ncbi:MAG: cohesin domain-containing protein [Saccharofermentanales bacterium]|jgi:hypothetical protein
MRIKKHFAIVIVCVLVMTLSVSFFVTAAERTATISSSTKEATVGQTVTITLGFTPKMETRTFSFRVTYDSSLLEYVSGKNISGLAGSFNEGVFNNLLVVGVTASGTQSVNVGSVLSLTFKVIGTGKATLRIIEALDGIIDPEENTIKAGASVSITLTEPTTEPTTESSTTTTTTTTITTKPTTTPTRTTPRPTTTTTTRTTATTTTTTTTSSETTTTTAPTGPIVAFSATRYDGTVLSVPESVPSDNIIPRSFEPEAIEGYEKLTTVYRSETLPYTLFWLADNKGEARFYYLDEETDQYVPFLRSEWSSRYFTFSVVPKSRLPEGFELTTLDVRGQKVPGYVPVKGFYMTHRAYYDLMSKVGPETSIPDWRHYDGNTTPPTSGDSDESSDATATTTAANEDNPLTWQGVSIDIPEEIFLVALRMNDGEEKTFYFYDQILDSLIRADLWLVPLARTFLEYDEHTEPDIQETTIPTDYPIFPSERDPVDGGAKTVNLFGLTVPLWLLFITLGLLGVLLLLILYGIGRAREAKKTMLDFRLDNESFDGDFDDIDQGAPILFDVKPEYDVAESDDTWKRLGIVNLPTGGEEQRFIAEEKSTYAFDDGEQVLDRMMPDDVDSPTPVAGNVRPIEIFEGDWAKLQKAMDRSSARQHDHETESEPESDAGDPASRGAVRADTNSVEETEKTIIQPGTLENRPIRRVPLRRLQLDVDAELIDQPLDEDEL